MSNDSIGKTLVVAVLLCLVCSIIVSGAAVLLKPLQQENKLLDKQKNILKAAGLYNESQTVAEQFSKINKQVINVETGEYANVDFDVAAYDQRKAKKDPQQSITIDSEIDIASLKRRAKFAEIYVVNDEQGNLKTIILPVSGYGLWSTLYGFVALESDLNTVAGLAFYDHAETPGLGGEVDNPKWKAQWLGKQIYNDQGVVTAKLKKGGVNPAIAIEKRHYVDGLSGATLTSNGVSNLIAFWLGENGFKPLLQKLSSGSLQSADGGDSAQGNMTQEDMIEPAIVEMHSDEDIKKMLEAHSDNEMTDPSIIDPDDLEELNMDKSKLLDESSVSDQIIGDKMLENEKLNDGSINN